MGRFHNSIELAKSSWAVLKAEKQLAVIPVLSFFATVAVAALFGAAIYFTFSRTTTAPAGSFVTSSSSNATFTPTPFTYVTGVVAYLAITFVVMFFTAALVGGAYERLTGGDATLGSCVSAASKRLPQIFLWSMLSGTIGLVLQSFESRAGIVGQVVARFADMAWKIVTFLAVPVIIAEGVGPIDALKRAASLFKQTWGENLIGQGALGIIGMLATLPGILVGVLIAATLNPVVGIVVMVAWVLIVSTVMAALNGIYRTALYLYAVGQPTTWFDQQVMAQAFRPRSGVAGLF